MLGFPFRKDIPKVDERLRKGETARVYVRRLALEKARNVAERRPKAWVVAADTAVVVDDRILGKPRDEREARRMLRTLSGRWHQVVSGIALVCRAQSHEQSAISVTRVRVRPLTSRDIRWYVASGEPADKAGAYAVQGKGGLFVERIAGSPSNVVGFPLERFHALLLQAGLWGQTCNS
jgi:septum formation protein